MPTNLTETCTLWLDSADLTSISASSGNSVSQWSDKSGGGYNATQGTSAKQPLLVTNATLLPGFTGQGRVLRFASSQQTLLNVNLSPLFDTPYCIFAVEGRSSNKGGDPNGNYFFGNADNGNQDSALQIGYQQNTNFRLAQWADDLNYPVAGFTTQMFNLWSLENDTVTGRGIYLFGNLVSSDNVINPLTGNLALGHVGSGYSPGGSYGTDNTYYDGDLAEIVVYNSALPYSDRMQVESYLTDKWFTAITAATSATFSVGNGSTPPAQRITNVTVTGHNVITITYATTAGFPYHLSGTASLKAPIQWASLPGSSITATGSSTNFTTSASAPYQFYRVSSP